MKDANLKDEKYVSEQKVIPRKYRRVIGKGWDFHLEHDEYGKVTEHCHCHCHCQ